ncbi:Rho GTPase-activating protein [Kluyveromyces lactis]|uniref:KLLA0E03081p n=1 Tax=Kluyveromyces lactis (strain ATCC 8585 / CBS 2359 / DSM 70799 / NBRC 1267 / NRRL Y-1140 / WM37) TaxID=284590 RepID=Q6CPQ5_KLULA|nr:uncharacterized protein KLLA0_E03081g [Kluyveromyces lactis]CAG99171.1 KLLA0E03081p [Kluyveromyces lactis]|eukprot:XP_454084.1 uncharacterized protein KLLA0_E03081g [Kluyveromyces lactis]
MSSLGNPSAADGFSHSQSPSKNQLTNWWRQFRNNPKSVSSETLSENRRKGNGSSVSRTNGHGSIPAFRDPSDEDFKEYRDAFLNQRHGFSGQVFNVPLSQSLSVASAEVIVQTELSSFGRIPIVVAKCGAYLKQQGLETSGIFRIAGNTKRIKELQYIFSTPPNYGAKFSNWDEFTVHDVASLLRRFLNHLQEPLIPLALYDSFRKPLIDRPRIIQHLKKASNDGSSQQSDEADDPEPREVEDYDVQEGAEINSAAKELKRQKRQRSKKRLAKDIKNAIKDYDQLFELLPDDPRQLFIYLLDLLSLFAQQSDKNLMTSANLAAIFQPSMISHPDHDMDPREYEISRLVVEFLLCYSYKILPHLLKLKKRKPQSITIISDKEKPSPSPDCDEDVEPSKENVDSTIVVPVTPVDTTKFNESDIGVLTPPDPHYLEVPKTRPYSKSLSSANAPSDMIASRRHSKIPFLNKLFVSDTEDEYDSSSRPSSPMLRKTGSTNSAKMLQLPSIVGISKDDFPTSKTDSDFEDGQEERQPRSKKRESWLQRLKSHSRSSIRE